MKKYNNYVEWIPFGISIGALFLYLRYVIMFKMDSNLVMTDKIHETLNTYLIVLFISLFIGLFIILIKKILLLKNETKKEIKLVSNKESKVVNNVTNLDKYNDKLLKVKVSDKMYTTLLKGKILGSNEDIEILFDDDLSYNNTTNIKDPRKCPKCDNVINKDAFICTKCGVILNKKALNDVISDFNIKEEKYIKPKKKLSVLIVNIIVIILSIFLIFLIGNKLINERNKNLDNFNIVEEVDN